MIYKTKPDQPAPFKAKKTIKGKEYHYWCARLVFEMCPETGVVPKPKDIYAPQNDAGKRKAIAKRQKAIEKPKQLTVDGKMLLADFITTRFLPDEESRASAKHKIIFTFQDRRSRFNNYFLEPGGKSVTPDLAKAILKHPLRQARLAFITPRMVKSFFNDLLAGGVGIPTLTKFKVDFGGAFSAAGDYLEKHHPLYTDGIALPEHRAPKKKVFGWNEVVAAILDPSKPLAARALVHTELECKARPSELWALRWADVDLEHRTVLFDKAVRRTKNGHQTTQDSKTGEKGNRLVRITPDLAATLATLKAARGASDDDRVFLTTVNQNGLGGNPITRDRWDNVEDGTLKALGLWEPRQATGPTIYSLKHLANSYAREKGASAVALADRMGHSGTHMGDTHYRVSLGLGDDQVLNIYSEAYQSFTANTEPFTGSGANAVANGQEAA